MPLWALPAVAVATIFAGYFIWQIRAPGPTPESDVTDEPTKATKGEEQTPAPGTTVANAPAPGEGFERSEPIRENQSWSDLLGRDRRSSFSPGVEGSDEAPLPAPRPSERPSGNAKLPLASGAGNLFAFSLSGTLGDKPLDADDKTTWGRVGFFLIEKPAAPYYLVFPGGSVPPLLKKEEDGTLRGPQRENLPGPQGDPKAPPYRLVIEASAKQEGGLKFYGTKVAAKYTCAITCRVEELRGGGARVLHKDAASETVTPTDGAAGDEAFLREAYDRALELLLSRLGAADFFRAAPR